VKKLLAAVNLSEALLDKYPNKESGGQARRVAIARVLVLEPKLIVADEPTAGLDVSIQGDLLNLMTELQREFGLTYLMVSHNLNVVRKVTDRTAVMYLGRIAEIGATKTVFSAPAHPYTHALISANPEIDPAKRREKIVLKGEIPSPLDPPPGCRFHTRCPRAEERCRKEEPQLRPMGRDRMAACHFPLVATP
jgi:peptide/nickel transport system ATP-binding protein